LEEYRKIKEVEEEKLKKVNKEEVWRNNLNILYKDTTGMNERQLQDHEQLCAMIRKKYGMM